ncbi:MAG: hypothetical protein ACE5GD_01545 [Candidatus Geothermarchaeales archaeon]
MALIPEISLPLIQGGLLLFLAIEQLYLFRFIFSGYKLTRDTFLFFLSFSFYFLLIGSAFSSAINFMAFFQMGVGSSELGLYILDNADIVLSVFEILGFSVVLVFPFLFKGRELGPAPVVPALLLASVNFRVLVNLLLFFLLTELVVILAKNLRKLTRISMLLMVGLSVLIFSKLTVLLIVILIPAMPVQTIQVIAVSLEVLAFSLFILIKSIVSVSAPIKPFLTDGAVD